MAAASDDACGSREIWRISGSQDARAITLVENRHTTTVRTFGARRDAHHKRSLDGRGSPLCFHRGGYENGTDTLELPAALGGTSFGSTTVVIRLEDPSDNSVGSIAG